MPILKVYDGSGWVEIPILDGVPGGELGGTWAAPTVDATHAGSKHPADILTTRGDLIRRGAAAPERVALGTDGQAFKSDGTDSVWEDDEAGIEFVIDGGGSAITTGVKGVLIVPFACTVVAWYIVANQSGSIVVDVNKSTFQATPSYSSIAASARPTLASAITNSDTTLTGWTTTLAAQDILQFEVDSVATVEQVTVLIKVKRT